MAASEPAKDQELPVTCPEFGITQCPAGWEGITESFI